MTYVLGGYSRAKLQGVHPDLVKVVERAIQISEVDFKVICGLRTVAEQKILVKTGKSKTMRSRHLTGHAVDIVPLPIQWNDLGPFRKVMAAMKKAAKELKVDLECGGDWKTFKDFPHYQLTWKSYP